MSAELLLQPYFSVNVRPRANALQLAALQQWCHVIPAETANTAATRAVVSKAQSGNRANVCAAEEKQTWFTTRLRIGITHLNRFFFSVMFAAGVAASSARMCPRHAALKRPLDERAATKNAILNNFDSFQSIFSRVAFT